MLIIEFAFVQALTLKAVSSSLEVIDETVSLLRQLAHRSLSLCASLHSKDLMDQSPLLIFRFARGNRSTSLFPTSLLRSRQLMDQSPLLISRFTRRNWWTGLFLASRFTRRNRWTILPSWLLASLEAIGGPVPSS